MKLEMDEHKFVFICGLHRSGTSIFHRCISDHPQISGFSETGVPEDEGQHLQDVYKTAKYYSGPGTFGFDKRSHLDETSDLAIKGNSERLFTSWSKYWNLSKPILVEKSPPNLVRSRFLQELFPNSYFLIVLRHPVAVSYATKKWSKTSVNSLIRHWLVCHEKFMNDKGFLKKCLMVKYEDFTEDPRTTLNSVCSFLDIENFKSDREIRSDVNQKYLLRWKQLEDAGFYSKAYKKYLIAKYENRVREFGYSLKI